MQRISSLRPWRSGTAGLKFVQDRRGYSADSVATQLLTFVSQKLESGVCCLREAVSM